MPIQCPYNAHTVPIQCPLEKNTVPIHFLYSENQRTSFLIFKIKKYGHYAFFQWALYGHCMGIVRALYGHCVFHAFPVAFAKGCRTLPSTPLEKERRETFVAARACEARGHRWDEQQNLSAQVPALSLLAFQCSVSLLLGRCASGFELGSARAKGTAHGI